MRQGLASVSEGSSLCQTRRTMEGKGWSLRLQAVPKSSLIFPDADTPIRRYADTFPLSGLAQNKLFNRVGEPFFRI
jgi:hypothetical protein